MKQKNVLEQQITGGSRVYSAFKKQVFAVEFTVHTNVLAF